ncbi:VSP [Giardia duodenalis]|uniref:VSP n=1 Tax=Giardia intestinalis (strain ATCC 50803 / WB clone C6) TaxID=184922 RepID=A8BBE8_GIAIC|nr:VSP [Giardia intestinalis]XP_001708278.1 VSP [Giardia intestinalis]KAE8302023.1 VSP [Giardia intestinalis]KAE8302558.1 VSP [Giardia intestinalis]|eukprot:XP_001708276.1 VSP [Giardia lamblia ATCC 50803]
MLLIAFYLVLSTLAVRHTTNHHSEYLRSGSRSNRDTGNRDNAYAAGNCKDGMEEQVGADTVCKQCNAGFVPINGVCTAQGTPSIATAGCKLANNDPPGQDSTVCEQCGTDATYFLYKGGCYDASTGVGQSLCKRASNGACTEAGEGYFAAPNAKATEQSVIPCSDTTGVTLTGDKQYVGVENCATCDAPAGDETVAKCKTCSDRFSLRDNQCVPSSVNKSGLSTGAIAGIAVAAVIVVGGLVGFLCWWFLCRGKA